MHATTYTKWNLDFIHFSFSLILATTKKGCTFFFLEKKDCKYEYFIIELIT